MNITLTLSVANVEKCLTGLGQLPFVHSADLINEIRTQATAQMAAAQQPAPAPAAPPAEPEVLPAA